ncbi:hypothetical protein CkaCkLH20_13254 [Colletotrichum karsti]|uniref:Uncharacterized protein n=1 Tax=Colletotrichum karsti TaxID=1095194 RepID=A0A9P6LDU0_9PEZI|nr:uncharacterized protein CkaCkLH20_13254 [Colletotrichum karsti]KAF9869266.1 hypothetical protein CkaCkLH20_13254 [Colletotrichum karsti]
MIQAKMAAKYQSALQPFHIDQQREWMVFAVRLFNADTLDLVMDEEEKLQALSLLAEQIIFGMESKRPISSNRIVVQARDMCDGKRSFNAFTMHTALLRYQLQPPRAWYQSRDMRQCLAELLYLDNCSKGTDCYAEDKLLDISPVPIPPGMILRSRENENPIDPQSFLVTQSKSACEFPSPTPPKPPRNAGITADEKKKRLSLWAQSPSNDTSADFGKYTSTSSSDRNRDSASNSSPILQTRLPVQKSLDRIGESKIIDMRKTTSMLDKIAKFDAQCVRELALNAFLADLRGAGWIDLEKSAKEVVTNADCDLRIFLAERMKEQLDLRLKGPPKDRPQSVFGSVSQLGARTFGQIPIENRLGAVSSPSFGSVKVESDKEAPVKLEFSFPALGWREKTDTQFED